MKKRFEEGKNNLIHSQSFQLTCSRFSPQAANMRVIKSLSAAQLSPHCLYTLPIFANVPRLPTGMSTGQSHFSGIILNWAECLHLLHFTDQ